ncbi:hypothetical protein ACPEEZ_01055 [Frigoribacterium sp. 2-23]|uniref:hypothetical protein n=1 Tax=Frigoribacterium sp. 2-23 TaxID=3415006 RepID=UPI003C6FD89B
MTRGDAQTAGGTDDAQGTGADATATATARRAQHDGEELAARAFAQLTLPDEPTLDSIVAYVAAVRDRPISVTELPTLTGTSTCGWWNALADRDEILIAPPLSEQHRHALVLHEVGHLVLDHTGLVPARSIATTLTAVAPTHGTISAARSHFTDATEVAAELLADAFARAIRRGPTRLSRFLGVFS